MAVRDFAMTLKLTMRPATGERQLRFVGDRLTFELHAEGLRAPCSAFLRTTLGAGNILNDAIVHAFESSQTMSHAAWHDVKMQQSSAGFRLSFLLSEPGFFRAKAYLLDANGMQHWTQGDDFGVSVHPDSYRIRNTIYCAWARLFGKTKGKSRNLHAHHHEKSEFQKWDQTGYSVIPPSGKLRDLKAQLPHIKRLGCRILHLLPVNSTPTTFARFGRFGSPYASLDLSSIDPALVEFDKKTTGIQQFKELTKEAHCQGLKVFIDLVINHTGWGARLFENHPKWFRRNADGSFVSPSAWGNVWADLVELDHHKHHENRDPNLGIELANIFLTWARRGVDGFRCDAGYMVPMHLWRYITAKLRREFPDVIFLLEGLGGAWEITEQLLGEGGMQWAYSELFQNYSGNQVAWYADYANRQSQRIGLYVHYSETHDNPRLAAKGKAWSLLRNRLCALSSANGGFGFTCGVEWLAEERLFVHQCSGLRWGNEANIIPELAQLNQLLTNHPCFFDGAKLRRLSGEKDSIFALERISKKGDPHVIVLVNTDFENPAQIILEQSAFSKNAFSFEHDLLKTGFPKIENHGEDKVEITLESGAAHCLSTRAMPSKKAGDDYREANALRAWIAEIIRNACPNLLWDDFDFEKLLPIVAKDPLGFLSFVKQNFVKQKITNMGKVWDCILEKCAFPETFPMTILWENGDENRLIPVPSNHWLITKSANAFELILHNDAGKSRLLRSVKIKNEMHLACFDASFLGMGRIQLRLDCLKSKANHKGQAEFLPDSPSMDWDVLPENKTHSELESPLVLLTNGRGAMCRLAVDFGKIKSKYDCLLGANLHSDLPVDRHIFAKRARFWANAEGIITGLNRENLASFSPGPPAKWRYLICAGKARWVPLEVAIEVLDGENSVVIRCQRLPFRSVCFADLQRLFGNANATRSLSESAAQIDSIPLSLTLRVDIEDRSFHSQTQHNAGSQEHFSSNIHALKEGIGFLFSPEKNRQLRVDCDSGRYHSQPEWCIGIAHPMEANRGQIGAGDALSPGWFEVPLTKNIPAYWTICSERNPISAKRKKECFDHRECQIKNLIMKAGLASNDSFGAQLVTALNAFVVKRAKGTSVIAGYPWFLDWGRDSLICARGLLACGLEKEVIEIARVYGKLEQSGTLPNSISGEDTSNRQTSDAPLWFGMLCSDLIDRFGFEFLSREISTKSNVKKKTFAQVLKNIANGYLAGAPNGVRVDADSGLVWSPSHFTWMDTNHPPGTPREGYPIEIQVMWIHLLRLLDRAKMSSEKFSWKDLEERARASFEKFFWIESKGYYADLICAKSHQSAAEGKMDSALRSNFPLAISTGLVKGKRAKRSISIALRHLIVLGGVRSLADLPVEVPLPIFGENGHLLNDPNHPYWGRYEGSEDTRRKPAYHNGTAWIWTLGILCEAILRAWDFSPEAKSAAKSYLGSTAKLLKIGCIGQLPEIMDGDFPHTQRGCDAQAWSVSEVLRVWKML